MNFFNNFAGRNHFANQDSSGNFEGYFSFGSSVSSGSSSFSLNIDNKMVPVIKLIPANLRSKAYHYSDINQPGSDSFTVIITSPENSGNIRIAKKGQDYASDNASVHVRQKEYIDWLKKRSSDFRNLSNQMITEIYGWEKTMELDNVEIGNYLHQYLAYSV